MRNVERILDELKEKIQNGKYSPLRSMLETLEPVDVAWLLGELEEEQRAPVFRLLPKEMATEVFAELEPDEQQALIEDFADRELKDVLEGLYSDDAADLIEEMPAGVVKRILRHTAPQKRAVINQLLNYPKDSAGSIMTTEYMALKADMTVAEAFERIRNVGLERETVYNCYVTDRNRKLEGVISVLEMLIASPEQKIGDLMNRNVIFFLTLDDQEQVARAFDYR